MKLALRPDLRAGTDEIWDRAESELAAAIAAAGVPVEILPGEGAFYGPKLEFHLRDAIGRIWQCGTHQLDFVLPERLDAEYVGEDGQKHRPVMLHRAIFGSFERFIGILIEHYAGAFPLWLSPVQVVVATITSDADGFAEAAAAKLRAAGLRVETDLRNEKIDYKVREHSVGQGPGHRRGRSPRGRGGQAGIASLGFGWPGDPDRGRGDQHARGRGDAAGSEARKKALITKNSKKEKKARGQSGVALFLSTAHCGVLHWLSAGRAHPRPLRVLIFL